MNQINRLDVANCRLIINNNLKPATSMNLNQEPIDELNEANLELIESHIKLFNRDVGYLDSLRYKIAKRRNELLEGRYVLIRKRGGNHFILLYY